MSKPHAVVTIGGSAGGLHALATLVKGLPPDLNAAVCIVLHIAPHSPSHLASILGRVSRLPVSAAVHEEPLLTGHIYVAVPDRHLMVDRNCMRLTRGPKESRSRPAIDVLFRSAAVAFGPRAVGVILSGLLDDGSAGLWAIKDLGGKALVQSPATAEYASMPESAMRHVTIDAAPPLNELAARITEIVGQLTAPQERLSTLKLAALQLENGIAFEGNALKAGVMTLGNVSKYTCPDCHGVLVQIEEGTIVRFRCHTGHAFSIQTLLVEINDAIDMGLWATLRAIEERILVLQQMRALAVEQGQRALARACEEQARDAEERLQPLRAMVLDPKLFGHEALASYEGTE